MKIENNGQGFLRKNLTGELEYSSFVPTPLSNVAALELSSDTVKLLSACSRKIGELEGMVRFVPNASMYLAMYVRKEALLSAQIEGTQCTFDDILDPSNVGLTRKDVSDVVAYVKATEYAVKRMRTLPLCARLLKETHEVLLEGTRGQEKNPGQMRVSQNWIGPAGCTLRDASFVPPNVDDMADALSEMEAFVNNEHGIDPIVKAALVHYQFETIHPFLDGNGRIGRLLILLYLMEQGLLRKPVIYVSYFLKGNQIEYYDRISEVRRSGNYEQWVRFFLEAVSAAAADAMTSIEQLSALHNQSLELLPQTTRSKDNIRAVFDYLEQHPIIDIKHTATVLGVSYNTVSAAVKKLMELDILMETTNAARNRVFAYEKYLAILREGT